MLYDARSLKQRTIKSRAVYSILLRMSTQSEKAIALVNENRMVSAIIALVIIVAIYMMYKQRSAKSTPHTAILDGGGTGNNFNTGSTTPTSTPAQ